LVTITTLKFPYNLIPIALIYMYVCWKFFVFQNLVSLHIFLLFFSSQCHITLAFSITKLLLCLHDVTLTWSMHRH